MKYHAFEWRRSRVHMLTVDLNEHEVRPTLAVGQDAFPFLRTYPIKNAIAQGAVASIGGGYNTTWYHSYPDRVADEPLHAMMLDREIWTTGVGAGGAGLALGDGWAATVERNSINIVVWPGSTKTPISVESVNHGHVGNVVAFTPRGGDSEIPGVRVVWRNGQRIKETIEGKHYTLLVPVEDYVWHPDDPIIRREMAVAGVSTEPLPFFANEIEQLEGIVLESRWKLHLELNDTVTWAQRVGVPGARTIASGWPLTVKDGQNVVPLLGLHGEASHGPDNWFIRKNPRMSVGVSKDGKRVILCAVEGRLPNGDRPDAVPSVGLRLKEMARLMIKHGAYNAINFDGGGSAFMWLKNPPPERPQLVSPGCYDTKEDVEGLRPDHFCLAVYKR